MRDNRGFDAESISAGMDDPMDEAALVDTVQDRASKRINKLLPCDPCSELHESGDPGRGGIDSPDTSGGWVEPGPNPEEQFFGAAEGGIGDIETTLDGGFLD